MSLALKPSHAAVKNYYAALHQVGQLHFNNEAQVSDAFAKLLADCGRKLHLTFSPQFPIQRAKTRVIVDGALLDTFPQYILRLIGQVVTVSLETVKIVKSLEDWAVP